MKRGVHISEESMRRSARPLIETGRAREEVRRGALRKCCSIRRFSRFS